MNRAKGHPHRTLKSPSMLGWSLTVCGGGAEAAPSWEHQTLCWGTGFKDRG